MSSMNSLAGSTAQDVGNYAVGQAQGVSVGTVANAVVAIPMLGGGLTNSGATGTSGSVILRRITVRNPSGNVSGTSVSIGQTNDGGNLVANAAALSTLTAVNKYQDLALSATANSTCVNANISPTLYVNVTAGATANGFVDIFIFGDVVNP
mgnify:CR=1 FL=1